MTESSSVRGEVLSASHPSVKKGVEALSSAPLHSVLIKTNKQFFSTGKGLLPFTPVGSINVVAGEPVAEEPLRGPVLDAFVRWSRERGQSVCGYYFAENFCFTEQSLLKPYQAGLTRWIELPKFTLSGYRSRDVRRGLRKGRSDGLKTTEITHPNKRRWAKRIRDLESNWFSTRKGPRIRFLLSSPSDHYFGAQKERWFVSTRCQDSELQAMISITEYSQGEFYIDHLIQGAWAHRFALDSLLADTILQLRFEGAQRLDFGLCAFQGIRGVNQIEKILRFNGRLDLFYNSKGVSRYKSKFAHWSAPAFMLLDPTTTPIAQLIAMARATYSGGEP